MQLLWALGIVLVLALLCIDRRTFWQGYARIAAVALTVGLGWLVWKLASGIDPTKAWWESPSAAVLITTLVGAIAPATAFVASWAKIQLDAQKQGHEIKLARTKQTHEINNDYLNRALDTEVPLLFRQQLLRFLATADDGRQLEKWAIGELNRIGSLVDTLNRDVEMAQQQREAAKTPEELAQAEARLRGAEARKRRAAETPKPPPLTPAALRVGAFEFQEVGPLDWPGADLHGANLLGCKFASSNFSGANLIGALLLGADARQSNFDSADLQGANCANADMRAATFRQANLKGARFTATRLEGTDFTGAILDAETKLQAYFDKTTKWPDGFDPVSHGAISVDEAAADDPKPS